MKYWTVQSKEILDPLNKKGVYYPDFTKSKYLQEYKDNNELYSFNIQLYNQLLTYACRINTVNLQGLVFTFCKMDNQGIKGFANEVDFQNYITAKKDVIYSLWKNLNKRDSIILELEFNEPFWNPLFIDINDYQYLMPPITIMPPYYEKDSAQVILSRLSQGCWATGGLPSGIAQAHLPYISVNMVKNVYNMFTI